MNSAGGAQPRGLAARRIVIEAVEHRLRSAKTRQEKPMRLLLKDRRRNLLATAWEQPDLRSLALMHCVCDGDRLLILINAGADDIDFHLPALEDRHHWHLVMHTDSGAGGGWKERGHRGPVVATARALTLLEGRLQ